jgi:hypothetical protein
LIEELAGRAPLPRVVAVEPDPDAAAAIRSDARWSEWLATGGLAVVAGPDSRGAADLARQFSDLHTAALIVDPDAEAVAPAGIERARLLVDRLRFQARANTGAREASAARYLVQTLANGPRLAREADAGALGGLLRGRPAVVVAAGPSLDRNIHDLWLAGDRAVVIACDTAARPLITAGIDPAFIVASDSSRANANHISSLAPSKSWLVAEGSMHPSAFAHFDGRTFVFRVADHDPWPWLRSIGLDRARIDTWGSVASSAFSLALGLGCDPIVFLGADFAFTGERPYARGTTFESQWASWVAGGDSYEYIWRQAVARWPDTREPDVAGDVVRTAPHLVAFRDWIVDRAAQHEGRRVVNATGAGILTGAHIEQAPGALTLNRYPVVDRAELDRLIASAHRTARGDVLRWLLGASSLLAGMDGDTLARWSAFTGGAIAPERLGALLQSAELSAWMLGLHHGRASVGVNR